MKRIISFFTIFLLSFSLVSTVLADGFIHVYDKDTWNLFDEQQQVCAINYKDGIQHMILTVNTDEQLKGEKAVWIFPVPARPEKISIDILKGFPKLLGYDVEEKADESLSEVFTVMRVSQIYTFPLLIFTFIGGQFGAAGLGGDFGGDLGVTVYERIEKMGLTTELVSAVDSSSLTSYVTSKGLTLPTASGKILDEYVGQEYSFVVSWISDIEKFNQEQILAYRGIYANPIGVYITFPTEKIYYPLKPTSVYGSKRVPAIIYVLDYVEPELYNAIKADTEVNYFFIDLLYSSDELKDFFAGYNKDFTTYYSFGAQTPGLTSGFKIQNVKYTKIKINVPSKYLTQDLWMEVSAPLKVKAADFVNRFEVVWGFIFFILCSCLASLLSGIIIFKDTASKIKLFLFGLWNSLTLIGFSIAAYLNSREIQQNNVSLGKIITRTLLTALLVLILLLFLLFFIVFIMYDFESSVSFLITLGELIIPILIIYGIANLFFAPFVWGYYNNRKIMKFIILFSVFFVVLTIIFQIFLALIV